MEIGIRELKNNLSQYIRRVEAGERVVVTAHGRVVAELVRPCGAADGQLAQMIASGVVRTPVENGDPLEGSPEIRLPAGTAASLINGDRDER